MQVIEKRILALGAHPDDIEFGCGGSLLEFGDQGHSIYLYIATQGGRGGDTGARLSEAQRSAEMIRAKKIYWGNFNDCEVPSGLPLIQSIENAVVDCRPDIVIVNYPNDTHQDHRALSIAAQSAARRVADFLFYETPTSLQFLPSVYVKLETTISKKLELLECHASQVTRTNINGLAITEIAKATAIRRGAEIFCRYAEAFCPSRYQLRC